MDVTMPDGRVIQGVPEGTTKYQLSRKLINAGMYKNEDFYEDQVGKDMGSSFGEGLAASVVSTGSNLVNMALPDVITPDWASDETLNERERLEGKYGSGSFKGGKLVGDIATTIAPVGGVGAGAAKLARATRPTSKVAKYLTNTLQKGAGRGAVEGATAGAILAGPDERGIGAATGAVFGGTLGSIGTALGKTLGKGSMVKITKEAEALQKLTGVMIPLSQAAEAGLTKQFYNAFLANFLGLGGKARGQYKAVENDLRRFIGEHAHPPRANIEIKPTDSVRDMMGKLERYWKGDKDLGIPGAFDSVKAWPITMFKGEIPTMPPAVARALKTYIDDGLVKIPRKGAKITGEDILILKNTLGSIMPKDPGGRGAFSGYQKQLEKLMGRTLNPSGKGQGAGAQALADWQAAIEYYPIWQTLRKAAQAADDKIFKVSSMGKAAPLSGAANEGVEAGMLAKIAMEDFPSKQGLFQTAAATFPVIGAGTAIGGPMGGAIAFLGTLGVGRAMLTKGMQKYLSGQTKGQALNKALMKKYEKELTGLGLTARQAAIVLGGDK